MNEYTYFRPGFSSIEEIEAKYGTVYDSTTIAKVQTCPRYYETRVEENLEHKGGSNPKMVAGIALHEGLEWYYAHPEPTRRIKDEACVLVESTWDEFNIDRAHMSKNDIHLSPQHLVEILENYFYHWGHKQIDMFTPLTGMTPGELNMEQVIAAKFKLTDTGHVVLGESNLIMEFTATSGDIYMFAGKPDLPVSMQDGTIYVMDHKTTSSYLSDWWLQQMSFEVSNKMRIYMAMVESLLETEVSGAVINGIHVGPAATKADTKATKFHRELYHFTQDHVQEAVDNQYAWIKSIDFYRELGYFPQGCGWGGCAQRDICRIDPIDRHAVKRTNYKQSTRHFWDL